MSETNLLVRPRGPNPLMPPQGFVAPPQADIPGPPQPRLQINPTTPTEQLAPPVLHPMAGADKMISARIPQGKGALNAEGTPLAHSQNVGASALSHGLIHVPAERLAAELRQMPDLRIPEHLNDEGAIGHAVNTMADNMHWIASHMHPGVIVPASHWYPGAHITTLDQAAQEGYPHEAITGAAARLSPQADWNDNASMSHRLARTHKTMGYTPETPNGVATKQMLRVVAQLRDQQKDPGARKLYEMARKRLASTPYDALGPDEDFERGLWLRAHDDYRTQLNPRNGWVPLIHPYGGQIGWKMKEDVERRGHMIPDTLRWQTADNVARAVSILRNPSLENISRMLGDRNHKIRNFYNNMVAPFAAHDFITADTHQQAGAHFWPMGSSHQYAQMIRGRPGVAATGSFGTYPIYIAGTREAAKRLDLFGRAGQSVTWEGARGTFPSALRRSPIVKADMAEIQRTAGNAREQRERIHEYFASRHWARDHPDPRHARIPAPAWFVPPA